MKALDTNIKKLFPLLIMFLSSLSGGAMKYQIKYLNTPTITINKHPLKVGDWFNDDAVINWDKDTQALRVLGENNKVYTLSAKRYKESKSKKFSDFIAFTKPMASRGMHTLKKDLQAIFENEFEILDVLQIDLSEVEDLPDGITILISSKDESAQPLSLTPENGMLIITREDIENISNAALNIPLTVRFVLPDSSEEIIVSEWFEVFLLFTLNDFKRL